MSNWKSISPRFEYRAEVSHWFGCVVWVFQSLDVFGDVLRTRTESVPFCIREENHPLSSQKSINTYPLRKKSSFVFVSSKNVLKKKIAGLFFVFAVVEELSCWQVTRFTQWNNAVNYLRHIIDLLSAPIDRSLQLISSNNFSIICQIHYIVRSSRITRNRFVEMNSNPIMIIGTNVLLLLSWWLAFNCSISPVKWV